jgi:hypothetical protein
MHKYAALDLSKAAQCNFITHMNEYSNLEAGLAMNGCEVSMLCKLIWHT